jgi:hypothetical protein
VGLWRNTLFVETGDHAAVVAAIAEVAAEEGRVAVEPAPREPEPYDEMQYGGGESRRWGFAVFPGAVGWTVVQSAPMEILLYPAAGSEEMRLTRLTRCLGCRAFQYNVYDGSGSVLVEADGAGRFEVSGFDPHDPERFGGPPDQDRKNTRFRIIEPGPAVEAARDRPYAVSGFLAAGGAGGGPLDASRAGAEAWLRSVGASLEARTLGTLQVLVYRVDAADVVARLALADPPHLDLQAESEAVSAVFAGVNAAHADNLISVVNLVRHEPLPMAPGAALYFE